MAATVEARRLTESHRLAQARLGAQTVGALRQIWQLLDPEDLDATFDRWLGAVLPVVASQRAGSARLAANYMTTFKSLELGPGASDVPVVLAEDVPEDALTTSMLVTGPVAAKSSIARGVPVERAMETALVTSGKAAMRHVLGGGRSTTLDSISADRQATGWARATSGQPCHFCAMIASRGPVYRSDRMADFESHDGCNCTAEPVYRDDSDWPAGSRQWQDLWQQAKSAEGDTSQVFRSLVEGGE